jgi:signal transduction histidine kinase
VRRRRERADGWAVSYRFLWVRLVCAWAIALVAWRLSEQPFWRNLELGVFESILGENAGYVPCASPAAAGLLVHALCLAAAVARVQRPFALALIAFVLGLVEAAAAAGAFVRLGLRLPIVAPLAALGLTIAALQAMAWSEERRGRRDLERLERERDAFADMLVHDLRNRLNTMLTAVRLIERETAASSGGPVGDLAHTLRSSARRMLLQVQALLDIRRMAEHRMGLRIRAVPLRPLLDEAAAELQWVAQTAGVRIVPPASAAGAAEPAAKADPDLCARVAENLLWNALQHAPSGPVIRIDTLGPADGVCGFSVSNRGPVIARDWRDAVFERFVSGGGARPDVRLGGSGLGLAFCKLAVEAQGGGLALESPDPGQADGVRITVRLQAA